MVGHRGDRHRGRDRAGRRQGRRGIAQLQGRMILTASVTIAASGRRRFPDRRLALGRPTPAVGRRDRRPAGRAARSALMGWDLAYGVMLVADWLTRHARLKDMPSELIAHALRQLLAPACRSTATAPRPRCSTPSTTPSAGSGCGQGRHRTGSMSGTGEDDPAIAPRPSTRPPRPGRAVELRLPETDDSRFGIVAELKADGFTHYLCMPILLMNGGHGWVTFATRRLPASRRPTSRPWRGCCPPSRS